LYSTLAPAAEKKEEQRPNRGQKGRLPSIFPRGEKKGEGREDGVLLHVELSPVSKKIAASLVLARIKIRRRSMPRKGGRFRFGLCKLEKEGVLGAVRKVNRTIIRLLG